MQFHPDNITVEYSRTEEALLDLDFNPFPQVAHPGDAGADIKLFIPPNSRDSIQYLKQQAYITCDRYILDETYSNLDITPEDEDKYIILCPGETRLVNTGFKVAVTSNVPGYVAVFKIYPRSGLATKQGVILANTVGIVDQGYRGEVMVALRNNSRRPAFLKQGDRIAQALVSLSYDLSYYSIQTELTDSARSTGGFGSTGIS